jgi:hypothetical protein
VSNVKPIENGWDEKDDLTGDLNFEDLEISFEDQALYEEQKKAKQQKLNKK